MKIALLGGTGNLGKGLAIRLARVGHEVIVGSRKREKAIGKAEEYLKLCSGKISGMPNEDAAKKCDIAFFTIPWEHAIETARLLRDALERKIVVSPLVPVKKIGDVFVYDIKDVSAAEMLASVLENSSVVSALHTIPAKRFADLKERFEWDVPVCGDDEEAKKVVIDLISEIDGLRPLDAGPLSTSRLIEGLTPLILNIMVRHRFPELGVKFV